MLLTFVQLHILLAAAPAFANWVLLCPAALGNVPAAPAQIVSLACRNVLEAATPATGKRHAVSARQAHSHLAVCQRPAAISSIGIPPRAAFACAQDTPLLSAFAPFTHAARAP